MREIKSLEYRIKLIQRLHAEKYHIEVLNDIGNYEYVFSCNKVNGKVLSHRIHITYDEIGLLPDNIIDPVLYLMQIV